MHRYIYDVVPATEEEVVTYMAAVYGSLIAPDYSLGGAGSSQEASDSVCHRFEWLELHEWGSVVTWHYYSLLRKFWCLPFLPRL